MIIIRFIYYKNINKLLIRDCLFNNLVELLITIDLEGLLRDVKLKYL